MLSLKSINVYTTESVEIVTIWWTAKQLADHVEINQLHNSSNYNC